MWVRFCKRGFWGVVFRDGFLGVAAVWRCDFVGAAFGGGGCRLPCGTGASARGGACWLIGWE